MPEGYAVPDPADNDPARVHANLPEALVAIQRDMPAVEKDGKAHHGAYTTLGHLLAVAKPILTRHGVTVVQFPTYDMDSGAPTLTTSLVHESGDRLESRALLPITKNDPQGHGSAITYLRRYALAAALGISDQEDDDGAAGSRSRRGKPQPTLPEDDVATLMALVLKKREEGLTFPLLSQVLGGCGIDTPAKNSQKAIRETLSYLDGAKAAELEKALTGWSA